MRLLVAGGLVLAAVLLAGGDVEIPGDPKATSEATGRPTNTDWELLGNAAEKQHHSELSQINTKTVADLGLLWSADLPAADGLIGNPLVANGRIFQSGAGAQVFANDLRTGEHLWTHEPMAEVRAASFFEGYAQRVNRGVALHDNLVIVATPDCRLVALDQATGQQRWDAQACDPSASYSISGAPRVGGGMVFIGNAGFDFGLSRGHVDAFDAGTGQRLWRFYTVPEAPGKQQQNELYEMAATTWGRGMTPSAGNVWEALTYDPVLSQLYVGTSAAIPLDPRLRGEEAGDELFTSSVVALDAKTGAYRWHFKQVPGDGWNYEPTTLMVAELPAGADGDSRRVIFSIGKDGFVYTIDARTGEFVSGRNFVRVNWASGLDEETGRPIYNPDARWWEQPEGAVVLPSSLGANTLESVSFDPDRGVLFIPAATYPQFAKPSGEGQTGEGGFKLDLYYGSREHTGWESFGELVAWDPVTRTARWRRRHVLPLNGGTLHTGGGLVFQGDAEGYFRAYDSDTGEELWSAPAGGAIRGAPSTVMLDGRQLIILPAGNGSTSITASNLTRYSSVPRSRSKPRLLAYTLGGSAPAPEWAPLPRFPKPDTPRPSSKQAAAGQEIFEIHACSSCHGGEGESVGGTASDLRLRLPVPEVLDAVLGGALAARGMPPYELSKEDREALHAYLVNKAWDAYEAQQRRDTNTVNPVGPANDAH